MSKGPRWRVVAAVVVPVAVAAALFLAGRSRDRITHETAAADTSEARLRITYPLEGTLFPPERVAPTFVWQDDTGRADRWEVVVRQGRRLLASPPRLLTNGPSHVAHSILWGS